MKFAWTKETKNWWTEADDESPILAGLLSMTNSRDQMSTFIQGLSRDEVTTKVRSQFMKNSHLQIDGTCWGITGC